MSKNMFYLILFVMLVMSIITFWIFYLDRRRARHRKGRVPDLVLILFALCGGSLGAMLSMAILKAKRRNPQYLIGMPLIFIVETTMIFLSIPW